MEDIMPVKLGQKVDRVVRFLMGAGEPRIVASLVRHGFSQKELDEDRGREPECSQAIAPISILADHLQGPAAKQGVVDLEQQGLIVKLADLGDERQTLLAEANFQSAADRIEETLLAALLDPLLAALLEAEPLEAGDVRHGLLLAQGNHLGPEPVLQLLGQRHRS
jgi:hypothetical protein